MYLIGYLCIVIIFPVILAHTRSPSGPPWPGLESFSHLIDVNKMISPFSKCLIILHEFSPMFAGPVEFPVITTGFYEKEREKVRSSLEGDFFGVRSKPFTNFTWVGQPRPINLNCLVEFFLDFPLEEHLVIFKSYIPFIEDDVIKKTNTATSHFHWPFRAIYQKYRVLVTNENNRKRWDDWIIASVGFHGGSHHVEIVDRMVFQTFDRQRQMQVHLVCEYCSLSSHTYERYDGPMDLKELRKGFAEVNKINIGVPWHMTHYQMTTDIWKDLVTRLENSKSAITFRSYEAWMNIEYLLFKTINPNSSVDPSHYINLGQCSSRGKAVKFVVTSWFNLSKECLGRRISIPEMRVGYQWKSQYFTIYSEERIKFLTCDGFKIAYDLNSFISSYTTFTWFIIFLAALVVPTVLQYGLRLKGHTSVNKIDIYLMPWSILFEQGDVTAGNKNQESFIYWLCGTWLLMAVVLSNAYKGENFTQLTSPLKPDFIKTFAELADSNFRIYNRPQSEQVISILLRSPVLINPKYWDKTIGYYIYTEIGAMVLSWEREMEANDKSNSAFQQLQRVVQRFHIPPNIGDIIMHHNGTYADSVSECNKTVLAMWKDEVDLSYYELKRIRPNRMVSRGVEELLISTKGFIIKNWVNHKILSNLAVLLHSGIASQWQKIARNSKLIPALITAAKSGGSDWSMLSLNDNTVILFYGLWIGFAMVSLTFCAEMVWVYLQRSSVIEFSVLD